MCKCPSRLRLPPLLASRQGTTMPDETPLLMHRTRTGSQFATLHLPGRAAAAPGVRIPGTAWSLGNQIGYEFTRSLQTANALGCRAPASIDMIARTQVWSFANGVSPCVEVANSSTPARAMSHSEKTPNRT